MRISYANSLENLKNGMDAVEEAMKRLCTAFI
jgi:hypothetical protein